MGAHDLLELSDKLWRGELEVSGSAEEGPDGERGVDPFAPRGEARQAAGPSLMATAIFRAAARESRERG